MNCCYSDWPEKHQKVDKMVLRTGCRAVVQALTGLVGKLDMASVQINSDGNLYTLRWGVAGKENMTEDQFVSFVAGEK